MWSSDIGASVRLKLQGGQADSPLAPWGCTETSGESDAQQSQNQAGLGPLLTFQLSAAT